MMPATPKVIHFIWAGGTRALPQDDNHPDKSSHHLIKAWAEANPGFQPILWIDGISLPPEVNDLYTYRGYQFIHDIDDIIQAQFAPSDGTIKPIVVVDIQSLFKAGQTYLSSAELTLLKDAIDYEMEKFHPNYGASSDLLRYFILMIHGGAYFDSDVPPGRAGLHSHPAFTQDKPYFNVTGRSQGRSNLGNDAFICSPAHPIMILLLQSCLQNFIQLRDYQNPEQFNTYSYLLESTLSRTGPDAVRSLLTRLNIIDNKDRFLRPSYRLGDPYTALDQSNTNHWLSFPTQPSASLEEAIKRAVKAMDFEMRYLNVCRHSDYVRDMSLSLRDPLLALLKVAIVLKPEQKIDNCLWVEHFKNLIGSYTKDIEQSDKDKRLGNFNQVLQDLQQHLETWNIEPDKIKRTLIKLEERYHPSSEARSKDKFNILFRLLDSGKGGILGQILAEENALIKLFDDTFKSPSEELKSAYMTLLSIAQGMPGLIPEHFPIANHKDDISAEHISYLLDIMNPDIHHIVIKYGKSEPLRFECQASALLGAALTQALFEHPDLDILLAQSSHKQADSQDKAWCEVRHKAIQRFPNVKIALMEDIQQLIKTHANPIFNKKEKQAAIQNLKTLLAQSDALAIRDILKRLNEIAATLPTTLLFIMDEPLQAAIYKLIQQHLNALHSHTLLESALALKADTNYLNQLTASYKEKVPIMPSLQQPLLSHWGTLNLSPSHADLWLNDEHIQSLLEKLNLPHTTLLPAIDANHQGDLLSHIIQARYLEQYAQDAITRFTVIPINFNNSHWALAVIEQNPERRSAPYVYFFDSLGRSAAKVEAIYNIIQQSGIYTQAHIIDLSPPQAIQTDSYTCGTWLVGAAGRIISTRAKESFHHRSWPSGRFFSAQPEKMRHKHLKNIQLFSDKPILTTSYPKEILATSKLPAKLFPDEGLPQPPEVEAGIGKESEYSSTQTSKEAQEDIVHDENRPSSRP